MYPFRPFHFRFFYFSLAPIDVEEKILATFQKHQNVENLDNQKWQDKLFRLALDSDHYNIIPVKIEKIMTHPKFGKAIPNVGLFNGDYALIKMLPPTLGMSQCIRFTDYARPACLNRAPITKNRISGSLNGYRRVNDVRMFAAQTTIVGMNVSAIIHTYIVYYYVFTYVLHRPLRTVKMT